MHEGRVDEIQTSNLMNEGDHEEMGLAVFHFQESNIIKTASAPSTSRLQSSRLTSILCTSCSVYQVVLCSLCFIFSVLAGVYLESSLLASSSSASQLLPSQRQVKNLPNNQFKPEHKFSGFIQNRDEEVTKKQFYQQMKYFHQMIPGQPNSVSTPSPDYYFFAISINQMIINSDIYLMYRNEIQVDGISWKQKIRAILRTQLVHNVAFGGSVLVELSEFDASLQHKERSVIQILKDEQSYYEQTYNLSQYNDHQLRFCLVVPSYNNVQSKLYLRNLDSIFMQEYHNYHVVYIDDASPDQTGRYVQKYLLKKGIPSDKINVIINTDNKKAMNNIYSAIHSHCPDGEIVGLIDGDDSLVGRKVLQLFNAVYHKKRAALVYSNFLKIVRNSKAQLGFGRVIDEKDIVSGHMRRGVDLMGSHLMTFLSNLFKKIKRQDLSYQNGTFFNYGYDKAILTPMIEMAFPRVEYMPELTYEYRNDTGINDGSEEWESVAKIIVGKKAYQRLEDFQFVDGLFNLKEITKIQGSQESQVK